jgi:hypothetical protein
MLPWFWHVYDLTGRFAFQDNSSSFATKDAFVQNVTDSSGADSASYEQFETQIVQQALTHPLDVARFVSAHYMHNAVFSYILLPQSFHVESLRSYVKRMPFWGNWEGVLSVESWFLLLINTSILALGVGAAWKRTKGLIFIPVVIGAAYNLSVAVSRRSGWRFILPADWVTLVFYAIGLVQIIVIVHSLIKRSLMEEPAAIQAGAAPVTTMRSYALSGLPFILIMLALVVGHKVFPLSYPSQSTDELVQMSGWDAAKVEQFLQEKDAVIMYGKALYPVYFKADVGALNYSWLSFAPKPYKRLAFYVIGPQPAGVIFPTASRPSTFPDSADVIVLGCKTESGDIDALSVVVTSTDSPVLYERDDVSPLLCPLPEPQ